MSQNADFNVSVNSSSLYSLGSDVADFLGEGAAPLGWGFGLASPSGEHFNPLTALDSLQLPDGNEGEEFFSVTFFSGVKEGGEAGRLASLLALISPSELLFPDLASLLHKSIAVVCTFK